MESRNTTPERNKPSSLELATLLKSMRLTDHYMWVKPISKWNDLDLSIWEALKVGLVLDRDKAAADIKSEKTLAQQGTKEERARLVEERIALRLAHNEACRLYTEQRVKRAYNRSSGEPEVKEPLARTKESQTRNVVQVIRLSDNKIFPTARLCADFVGVSPATMVRWLDQGTEFERLGPKKKPRKPMKKRKK